MVVKVNEKYEMTRHIKNKDKSKKYNLGGERNGRQWNENLSKSRERQQNFYSKTSSEIFAKTILANILI